MNMQAIMKQAQAMQKDMIKSKNEIDSMEFIGESSFVSVVITGNKSIKKISIDHSIELTKEDIEMLEDILVVAINDAFKKVDKETENKMGQYSNIPGLF